jgi:16S rRNA G1207 methylase RsmC
MRLSDSILDLGVGEGALISHFSGQLRGLDVTDRGYPLTIVKGLVKPTDGFPSKEQKELEDLCHSFDWIISNPPFSDLETFIHYASKAKKGF